jgi:hypothetical protein
MKLFLREAHRLDNAEIAARMSFTRTAVWGDENEVKSRLKDLEK